MGQANSNIIPASNALGIYDEVDVKSEYGTIISHKTTKNIFLFKELNFPDHDEYKKALKHYESRKGRPYENVLNLVEL